MTTVDFSVGHSTGDRPQNEYLRNLRLQFLAGMSPSLYQEEAIFADMSRSRKYPENIFAASPETKAELKLWIDRTPPPK